ncbi:hypothetical protein MLD38_002698 [Melastoma candidum]|uniref:Uncharacterized protein n=1 Tax=Melastoma candidum TaxID=119954 RepID=A0ACB9S0E2_9MYRT|nr:hypothetical protein MLD38_002698 [Melastoma candidum]
METPTPSEARARKKGKWKLGSFVVVIVVSLCFVVSARGQGWDGVVVTEADYQALQELKHDLVDPKGFLRSWNDSGFGACSGGWAGIKCAQGQVIVLQLPWKSLGGRLTEKIGQFQALRKLSLHDNVIGGPIPSALGFLPNLRGVQLFNNRFAGSIPPSLGDCPLLQTLDVSNNSLTGSIPESLANCTKLYRLNVSFNSISGSVPVGVISSPSLIFLAVQHNNISGSIPEVQTRTGKKAQFQLRSLAADHNFISGKLPVSLGEFKGLQEVYLGSNNITGLIPDEVGNLPILQILDLSFNSINGSLPPTFSNLSSLVLLNLEGNSLDTRIPEIFNKVHNLSVLNLKGNRFIGPIPTTLGNISSLTSLDLSLNSLAGEIPPSIGDLPNLVFLNVSYNNLSGSVPAPLSKKFNASSFRGNIQLCGFSGSTQCPSPAPSELVPPLPPSEAEHHGRKLSVKDIILIVAGALLVVLVILCCILLCCLIRKRSAEREKDGQSGTAAQAAAAAAKAGKGGVPTGVAVEAGGEAGGKLVHFDGPMVFTADDLLCATAEIMGKSTYGTVYKATLEDGSQVAVKRLREKITKGQREFESEVNVLGRIRHPNLLALRAYYLGPKGEKLLVFDYMPKGSLATFLHARGPETPIDWPTRMRIAQGKSPGEAMNGVDLPQWVASIVKEEWTNEVFDLELMREAATIGDELLNTLKLALHCVDPSPLARPEVNQILQQLEEIRPGVVAAVATSSVPGPSSGGDDGTGVPSSDE